MGPEPDATRCGCESRLHHLTQQEIQVLLLAAEDLRDREIAGHLYLSARTIQQHFASMRRKARVRTRGGLIVRSYFMGVLQPEEWPPRWSGWSCLSVPRQRMPPPG